MTTIKYDKSNKYSNLDEIYSQCSGPGGLQLAEFMAEKMRIVPDRKLLDIGCNRGWQTCFLAKEYDITVAAVDPWDDRADKRPMVNHLMENAEKWGVDNRIIGMKTGVPDLYFADGSFDYAYSTTALEMVRVSLGISGYKNALKEIFRVLKSGGIFGIGEPMHLDTNIPEDLKPYVTKGEYPWSECFRSLDETVEVIKSVGFEIVECGYADDARPFSKADPNGDAETLKVDNGRWTSFGYIICTK